MATYTIDLPGIPSGSAGEFPHTADALEQIAGRVFSLWLSYAQGAPLPNGQQIQARTVAYGGYTPRRYTPSIELRKAMVGRF